MEYYSNYYGVMTLGDELTHHGIKGMKWGVRRYQNPDGTLTALGKKKYGTVENFDRHRQERKRKIKSAALTAAAILAPSLISYGSGIVRDAIDNKRMGKRISERQADFYDNIRKATEDMLASFATFEPETFKPETFEPEGFMDSLNLKDMTMEDLKKMDLY